MKLCNPASFQAALESALSCPPPHMFFRCRVRFRTDLWGQIDVVLDGGCISWVWGVAQRLASWCPAGGGWSSMNPAPWEGWEVLQIEKLRHGHYVFRNCPSAVRRRNSQHG